MYFVQHKLEASISFEHR